LHMDDRAAKWVQVYKLEHGLDSWSDFIEAVEQKFGATDYREALSGLFDLHQTTTIDDYITAFEGFQYQLTMHNRHLGEMFFVTQFIKGLLPGISAAVLSQVPDTMQRATMLARIQQQLLDQGKLSPVNFRILARVMPSSPKGMPNPLARALLCGRKDK